MLIFQNVPGTRVLYQCFSSTPNCGRVSVGRFGPKNPQQQRFSLRTKSPMGQHVPTVPKTATHLADGEAESVVWLITAGMSMVLIRKWIISPLYK